MPSGLPAQWANDVLLGLGIIPTNEDVSFLEEWQRREGGGTANSCDWNPLNTTLPIPSQSHPCNPVGVQSFNSWAAGDYATDATLQGYPAIVRMLRAGHPDPGAPGVSAEFLKWSGGGYTWPGGSGGGSSSGGGGSSGGTGGGVQDPSLSAACQAIVNRVNSKSPPQITPIDNAAWTAAGCPGNLQAAVAKAATSGTGSAAGPESYDLGNLGHDIASPFELFARIAAFIFSIRFLEILGGGALILLGIALLGKQLGVSPPLPGAAKMIS